MWRSKQKVDEDGAILSCLVLIDSGSGLGSAAWFQQTSITYPPQSQTSTCSRQTARHLLSVLVTES